MSIQVEESAIMDKDRSVIFNLTEIYDMWRLSLECFLENGEGEITKDVLKQKFNEVIDCERFA